MRDHEQKTPLHLAVKNFEETQSKRNIKLLLFEGASRRAQDRLRMRPVDYAKFINNPRERLEVLSLLQEPRSFPCF